MISRVRLNSGKYVWNILCASCYHNFIVPMEHKVSLKSKGLLKNNYIFKGGNPPLVCERCKSVILNQAETFI